MAYKDPAKMTGSELRSRALELSLPEEQRGRPRDGRTKRQIKLQTRAHELYRHQEAELQRLMTPVYTGYIGRFEGISFSLGPPEMSRAWPEPTKDEPDQ